MSWFGYFKLNFKFVHACLVKSLSLITGVFLHTCIIHSPESQCSSKILKVAFQSVKLKTDYSSQTNEAQSH